MLSQAEGRAQERARKERTTRRLNAIDFSETTSEDVCLDVEAPGRNCLTSYGYTTGPTAATINAIARSLNDHGIPAHIEERSFGEGLGNYTAIVIPINKDQLDEEMHRLERTKRSCCIM